MKYWIIVINFIIQHITKFKFAKLDLKSGFNGTFVQLKKVKKYFISKKVLHNLFNYMNTKPFVNTQSSHGPKTLNELIEILEEKYELLKTVISEL